MTVHRPPDSRLLSNLIAHEKEYTKHLSALFPISHGALASLSAFAAASPSAIPTTLQSAVENWRDQLGRLIKLEEDITAILRDREILVTRLIKVSKSSKTTRDPRSSLVLPSGSTSLHLSLLPILRYMALRIRNFCKLKRSYAHLEKVWCSCQALIDCGWVWGEMGKEGLRALQSLNASSFDDQEPPLASSPSHLPPRSVTPKQKPSPSPALPSHVTQAYSSDISSLTPSQSASQQHDGPSRGTSQEARSLIILALMIKSADDSSEEETQGPLEVVENDPFIQLKRLLSVTKFPQTLLSAHPSVTINIGSDQTRAEWSDATESPHGSPSNKGKKGWSTRTDANLKASRSRNSSDSEPDKILKPPPPSGGAKLRKGRSQMTALASSSGWQTDGPPSASPRTSVRRKKKKSVAELKGKDGGYTDGELDANDPSNLPSRSQSEVVPLRPSVKRQDNPNPPTPRLNHLIFHVPPRSQREITETTELSGNVDNTTGKRLVKVIRDGQPPLHMVLHLNTWGFFWICKIEIQRTPKAGTVHPLPAKGSTSVSLMSIVEDVARQNRDGRGATATGSSSTPPSTTKLEVPRAPIPGVPTNAIWSSKLSGDRLPVRSGSLDIPRAPGSVVSASQSFSVISTSQSFAVVSDAQGTTRPKYETPPGRPSIGKGSGPAAASGSQSRKTSRPPVSPLRSALRNSSRTPSPSPAQLSEIRKQGADVHAEEDKPRGRTEREDTGERTPRPSQPRQATELNDISIRDSVSMTSISSYRTAEESPADGEQHPRLRDMIPSHPQSPLKHDKAEEQDDEAHGRYPWSSTKKDCDHNDKSSEPVIWQDSSDEDEEYSRARKLLSRAGKRDKGKKKNV
ncbi:hypothetical protein BD769DRAFT_1684865 [Suillus cothurnatus]|nr:hypothetical protein BD769DRAFT_1684865 [Suillus cothurnatus]